MRLQKRIKKTTVPSVQLLSRVWLFVAPWTAALQASLSFTISRSYSNSSPLNWWCHPTILSSVIPFFSSLLSFPASESLPMSWLLASGGQDIGASASALALSVNIQSWFPLGLTGWISLQSKGLSRVFFNTKVQKHQFFITQLYVQLSHPYMTTGKAIAFSSGEGREIMSFLKVAFCSQEERIRVWELKILPSWHPQQACALAVW